MENPGSKRAYEARFEPQLPLDLLIAELAASQHSVVALWQLVERGLSPNAVRKRVAAGRLHRVHEGVYAVGHPRLTRKGYDMAAVLACGRRSALSHRSAAAHRELRQSTRGLVDVISPRRPGRKRAGIDAHTSSTLLAGDIEDVDGIPCTSVARTLLDLAAVLPRRAVERAFDEAEFREVLDARAIEDVLERTKGHRGNADASLDPRRASARDHADPQRPRGGVLRDLPRRRPAAAGGQRLDRARADRLRGRLPLALAGAHRRDRRRRRPHDPARLRARPPARPAAHARRLPHRALHVASGVRRAAHRRGDARRAAAPADYASMSPRRIA